jgi:serine/threonine-protein kinase RsbW
MPPKANKQTIKQGSLMSLIPASAFIGRGKELERLSAYAEGREQDAPLLVLAAPCAGASELLRQTFDLLFARQGEVVPVYFAWSTFDRSSGAAARRFLKTFLAQMIAFRRNEPELCRATLAVTELIELAPASDQEWLEKFWRTVEAARKDGDEAELVRLCLSAPERAGQRGARFCLLHDQMHAADWLSNGVALVGELARIFGRSGAPAVLAGYRRQLLNLVNKSLDSLDKVGVMRLNKLSEADAQDLLEQLAARSGVELNSECRDLLVLQTGQSPVFLHFMVEAARAGGLSLTSFRQCQQLYVNELMGGRIHRYFAKAWSEIAPSPAVEQTLLTLLSGDDSRRPRSSSLETWRKRLKLEDHELARLVRQLQAREWIAVNGPTVDGKEGMLVWQDFAALKHALEIEGKPRAQARADALAKLLKRAPQLLSSRYRRAGLLPLRDSLELFDGRKVPYSLLDAHHFALLYEDLEPEELPAALEKEETLVALPQIITVATCASYNPAMKAVGEEESCLVAHGFDAGRYTDEDEIVWLAAQIESKNAARRGVVKIWHEGLAKFAQGAGIKRYCVWLICPAGFAAEARAYLTEQGIFASNAAQFAALRRNLRPEDAATTSGGDDFEMVIPMTDEAEMVSTSALEEIARRIGMPAGSVNQMKTALVEACINATEHSRSPERKIYQRFTVKDDRLIVTVSSRGLTQPQLVGATAPPASTNGADRRGWGLKLIHSLVDEVEFEQVDDGTRLRMVKYRPKDA